MFTAPATKSAAVFRSFSWVVPRCLGCAPCKRRRRRPRSRIPPGRVGVDAIPMSIGPMAPSADAPLLFQSRGRQRILAGLAHYGPLRLRDATEMAHMREPSREQLGNFDRIGATVRFGNDRVQVIAFNRTFPGLQELRRLILAVEPTRPPEPRLPLPRDLAVPACEVHAHGPRDLFGPWRQTAALLTVAVCGGEIGLNELQGRLRTIGCAPPDALDVLRKLEERGLISVAGDRVGFAASFRACGELVTFARAFVEHMPTYRLAIHQKSTQPLHQDRGRYSYGGGAGLPEIFGRPVRYRAFVTLAVHGPMRRQDLVSIAHVGDGAFDRLVRDGWLYRAPYVRGNLSRTGVTIGNIPGRENFLALLRRMAERWPAPDARSGIEVGADVGPGPAVRISPSAYFGTPARGHTLLTLAAMGKADVSMLARAVSSHDRQELSRALRMFAAYGIVRTCELDGRGKGGFELDPTWVAATELRGLLDALLRTDQRYHGRASAAEEQMPQRRFRMREKAVKRRRNASPAKATVSRTRRRTSDTR